MNVVATESGTVPVPPSVPQASVQALAAGCRERRITTHEQVWHLKGEGWTAEAIARHLVISRASVFRNLRHEVFPERERRTDAGRSLRLLATLDESVPDMLTRLPDSPPCLKVSDGAFI